MVTQVLNNTFLSKYKDDFRDSDNYHRILFNSGRALQARELTQLQTIIQKEIQRLGNYLFKESSVISGNLGSAQIENSSLFFAKLNTTTNALPTDFASLEGTYFTNASGLQGLIKKVILATGGDPDTLIYSITDGADQARSSDTETTSNFSSGEDLTLAIGGTLTIQTVNTSVNPAVGLSSVIDLPETETFTTGHFVFTPSQTLVISKYSNRPTDTIVYKVDEEIVTVEDDQALYDNTGSTPNLTSPGADRLRIKLTLDVLSNIDAATTTFIPLVKLREGIAEPLQFPDSILNKLGELIANRTYDTAGDFVVRTRGRKFGLKVVNGDSDGALIYQLDPGTAFLNGYRYDRPITTTFNVKKARNDPSDIVEVDGENVLIEYGNYFLCDSAYGLLGAADTFSEINLYNKPNIAGSSTTLGTARIRNIEINPENKHKFYLFDIVMDSNGSGTLYNTSDIKSFGTDSANYANNNLIQNRSQLLDINKKSLLFEFPRSRVYELSGNINLTVKDVLSATTNGSGEVTFNTASASEDLVDEDEWILAYDSAGELLIDQTPASGGAGSTSVQFTGLLANQPMKLLCYVSKLASSTTKTKATQTESLTPVNNVVTLTKPEFIELTSVVDDDTNEDITYKYTVQQTLNNSFYQATKLKLVSGFSVPIGNVTATYNYLSRSASGDFSSVNSYSVTYKDIPQYQRETGAGSLADVIDFRSVKNYTGSTWDTKVRVPRNRDVVTFGTVKHFGGRIDLIYMGSDGLIKYKKGDTGFNPKQPDVPPLSLPLHFVKLLPFTYSNNDIRQTAIVQDGYRMNDIRTLENRINNVEYLTSLTLSELNLSSLAVIDENGLERTKVGIFAENFSNQSRSLILGNVDYRAAIHRAKNQLRPRVLREHINLLYDSDLSNGTIRKGGTVWPKYDEEVFIDQGLASNPINVNQVALARFTGTTVITPDADTWTERRTVAGGSTAIATHGDLSSYDDYQEYASTIEEITPVINDGSLGE